jgi:Fe-S-cluster containining protein
MEIDSVSVKDLGLTSEQQKAVGFLAEFAKRMVTISFPGHKTPSSASHLIKEIYRVTDDMMTGCFKSGPKLPCKKGCFWCCFLQVKATPLEVMCVADYLHARLKPEELSKLQQRLVTTDEKTRGTNGRQRVCAQVLCPLLVGGECLAYPVRPIACRVYHSLNLADCKALLNDVSSSVTVHQAISRMSMGIFAGLTVGLRTVGLQTCLLELIAGLRIAMEEPGSGLMKTWLSGEPAFVEAEIAGSQEIESFYQVLVDELGGLLQI